MTALGHVFSLTSEMLHSRPQNMYISTCAHGFISTFSNNSQLNFSAVPSCSHFAGVAELMHIDLTPYDETNGAPDGCQNMFRTGENAGTGLLQ